MGWTMKPWITMTMGDDSNDYYVDHEEDDLVDQSWLYWP